MERAVFGVDRVGGEAAYSGTQGGQKWLPGSAPGLASEIKGRAQLDRFFPSLQTGPSATFGVRGNRLGVVHIQLRRGRIYVVLVHQPSYSLARAIPLWLCARLDAEELDSDGSILQALMRDLCDARDIIAADGESPIAAWCGGASRAIPVSGSDLEVSRRVADLVERGLNRSRGSGSSITPGPSLDDGVGWRAWQFLLRAISKSWPEGRPFIVAMALEDPAVLPTEPDGYSADVFQLVPEAGESVPATSSPWTSRGVSDEVVLSRVSPRVLLESAMHRLAGERSAIPSTGDWPTHSELVAQEIPIDLVPESLLRIDELPTWAGVIWDQGPEAARARLRRIVEMARSSELGESASIELILQLLMAAASRSHGDVEALLGLVQAR